MRKRWNTSKWECLRRFLWAVWPRVFLVSQLRPILCGYCMGLCLLDVRWTFSKLPVLGSFNAGRCVPHVANLTVFTLWRFSRPLDVILVCWETSCRSTETSCHALRGSSNLLHPNRVSPVLRRLLAQANFLALITTSWAWSLSWLLGVLRVACLHSLWLFSATSIADVSHHTVCCRLLFCVCEGLNIDPLCGDNVALIRCLSKVFSVRGGSANIVCCRTT